MGRPSRTQKLLQAAWIAGCIFGVFMTATYLWGAELGAAVVSLSLAWALTKYS